MAKLTLFRRLRQFGADQSGAIAMLFALVLVPMLLTIGMSIDYARATTFQTSMQHVLDEAVVAGASQLAKSGYATDAERAAKRRFEATRPEGYEIFLSFSTDTDKGTVAADAEAHVPMMFMGLAGFKTLKVHAHAAASAKPATVTRNDGENRGRAAAKSGPPMSESEVGDVIHRVQTMCYKLRQLNFTDRVPQCRAVFDGTFEQQLRSRLASNGDATSLLPGGVRLVQ